MSIKRFKQSQKFRVVSGNTSFYATAKEIRSGVGDFTKFNAAVRQCMESLESLRSGGGVMSATIGQAGTWQDINIQLDMA